MGCVSSERNYVHCDVSPESFIVAEPAMSITLGNLDSLLHIRDRLFGFTRTLQRRLSPPSTLLPPLPPPAALLPPAHPGTHPPPPAHLVLPPLARA